MTSTPTDSPASAYEGRTVLVTGGAGAIGSNLTAALLAAGASVVVLDSMTAGYRWNLPRHDQLLVVEADILDETALKRVFAERPAVVFHLAAFFANQNSVDYPERDLMVNGLGTLRLLEYATMTQVDRFVFTSSSSIYGTGAPLPVPETHTSLHLSTPYQITKLLGELYSNFYHHHHDLPISSVRLFNSYGPGEVPGQYRNVIPNFLYWALRGDPLPITGTGEETRDFTFVGDVVDGMLACGSLPAAVGEVYNLAGGRQVSILDLAQRVLKLTGSASEILHRPARKWDTKKRFEADTTKAREQLAFRGTVEFDDGLARTHQWFVDNWANICDAAPFGAGRSAAHGR